MSEDKEVKPPRDGDIRTEKDYDDVSQYIAVNGEWFEINQYNSTENITVRYKDKFYKCPSSNILDVINEIKKQFIKRNVEEDPIKYRKYHNTFVNIKTKNGNLTNVHVVSETNSDLFVQNYCNVIGYYLISNPNPSHTISILMRIPHEDILVLKKVIVL